jgi:hypothetical protein
MQQDTIIREDFDIANRTIMPDIYCNPNAANVFQKGAANAVVVADSAAVYNQKILARVLDVRAGPACLNLKPTPIPQVADPAKQDGAILVYFRTEAEMMSWYNSQVSLHSLVGTHPSVREFWLCAAAKGSVVKQAGCDVQLLTTSKSCNVNAAVRAATRRHVRVLLLSLSLSVSV